MTWQDAVIMDSYVNMPRMGAGAHTFSVRDFQESGARERVRTLKWMTKVKVKSSGHVTQSYQYRRSRFKDISRRLLKKWITCAVCDTKRSQVVHHIVMLCNGGPNTEANLLGLCRGCHQKIHPWLRR